MTMGFTSMADKIDLQQLRFSVLFVRPKTPFFDWLKATLAPSRQRIEDVFFPEELPVWLIPRVSSFGGDEQWGTFLRELKPRLLKAHLDCWNPGAAVNVPMTADQFDVFFEAEIRDEPRLAPDVGGPGASA